MPATALIIALLTPQAAGPVAAARAPAAAVQAQVQARLGPHLAPRLTLWGTNVRWDDRWRAFVSPEVLRYAVVPVWERYETPSAEAGARAPSYVVMRELDCGQGAWRTTGVVSFPRPNLEGEARFEPSGDPWRSAAEAGAEIGSIYGSVCRR